MEAAVLYEQALKKAGKMEEQHGAHEMKGSKGERDALQGGQRA